MQVERDCVGPKQLNSDVQEAIKRLRRRKAEGEDGIPAEFIQACTRW